MGNQKGRIVVRGVLREEPDIRRLAKALIELAIAENERSAEPAEAADRCEAGEAAA